jgi:MFS family permease
MTLGQMSEVLFMVVMPFFFVRLGIKKMLIVGMLAWAVRYLLFAFGNPSDLVSFYYLGILLHGICYDFFFVTGQIYVDNAAPRSIQASAQGFITLITYGVGMLIGSLIAGWVVEGRQVMEAGTIVGHEWQAIWLVPAAMSFGVLILFALLFNERAVGGKTGAEAATAP